ncbi:o-succinylbenzoate--CoA ligase [Jeotgalibacillus soli]|uniref:2-succinylbenzoate--CoA ligase n=1 Tax=Jeotgalibacillus soli TaxID=889306 RepID=A0A0C2VIY0_9BACL|nr:O-succinylbenzoic acid--CoA ligase [Jeotgalibacillus soli]
MNFSEHWLSRRAALTPNRIAIHTAETSLTFAELLKETTAIAEKLSSLSLDPAKPVALMIRNSLDGVFLIHALQQLAIPALMVNHRLSAAEWKFQLQDSHTQLLIVDDVFDEKVNSLKNELSVYTIGAVEQLNNTFVNSSLYDAADREVCSIMYTSGTTGRPKAVAQTYANHFFSAMGSALNLGMDVEDTWLCAVPLFHISGYSILMRSVIYGNSIRLYEQFDEEKIHDDIEYGRATMISVVTTMLLRLLAVRNGKPYHKSFRCMLLGGGPAAPHIIEECFEAGIPVFQTYGMTETASQFATLSPEDSRRKIGSAGKPLFTSEISIVNTYGDRCKANEVGEITVKGPNVTPGYLNHPEANETSFKEGWFYTGDIGYLDDEGFLFVLDRRSDLIISGGENIYPAEIEAVLTKHPAILEAGVVGKDDPSWGQVPVAFIVLEKGFSFNSDDYNAFCKESMAGYKVPKVFYVIDKLPRNASNKLLRRELKKRVMNE